MWTQRPSPSPSPDPIDHRRLPSSEPQARLLSQCICDGTPSRARAGTAGTDHRLSYAAARHGAEGASLEEVMGAGTRRCVFLTELFKSGGNRRLTGKVPDARKDQEVKEKKLSEDETAGQHH